MELSLRKARKLEAKIQSTADSLPMSQALKVRVLASTNERAEALNKARSEYNGALDDQKSLIKARFAIRDLIAKVNAEVGINSLMSQRELVQALLAKSTAGVDSIDFAASEDMAMARKNSLEKGMSDSSYSNLSVTIMVPVSTKEDVSSFMQSDKELKKQLEEIEDQLSQKNLGAKISIDEDTVNLLRAVGLV